MMQQNSFYRLLNLIEGDAEQKRKQIMLYILLGMSLFTLLGLIIVAILLPTSEAIFMVKVVVPIIVLFFLLTYQQHVLFTCYFVPISSTIFVSYLIVLSGQGLRSVWVFAYLILIVEAGVLIGVKGVFLLTGLSITLLWGLYLTQYGYQTDPTLINMSLGDLFFMSLQWLTFGCFLSIAIWNLERTIEQTRLQEQTLLESNQALELMHLSLEETIQERTQKAELAQKEAESARKQMAQQVWLMQGQAELADVMRGEHPIEQLAQEVVRKTCQYLQLPTGALFVMQEGQLNFVGGYAFMPNNKQITFSVGEGAVGEAARTRTHFMLQAEADEPWQVVSGTTVHQVQHILVYPFLYEEAVMGVIEVGSWMPFSDPQLLFLERSVESIGIAFHSAYTRNQMNALLRSL